VTLNSFYYALAVE